MSGFVFFFAICLVACQASPSPTGADNRDKRDLPAELDGGNRRFLDLHIHRRSGGGCPGGCRRSPCDGGNCSEGPNMDVQAYQRSGCPGGNCRRNPCNGGGCAQVSRCSGGNCNRMRRSAIGAEHREKRSAFNGDWRRPASCLDGRCGFGYPGENPCAGGSCGSFAPAPCSGGGCGRFAPRATLAIDRSGCSGGNCRRMKRSANPQCPGGGCGLMAMHGSQAPMHVAYQGPLHVGYQGPLHVGYQGPLHVGYQAPMHMNGVRIPLYRGYGGCAGGNCMVKRSPDNGFSTHQRRSEAFVDGDHIRD